MKDPYHERDHIHCPSKDSPCGIEGEHRCCLCMKDTNTKSNEEELREFLKEFRFNISRYKERNDAFGMAGYVYAFLEDLDALLTAKDEAHKQAIEEARREERERCFQQVCLVRGNIRDKQLFEATEVFIEALAPTKTDKHTPRCSENLVEAAYRHGGIEGVEYIKKHLTPKSPDVTE